MNQERISAEDRLDILDLLGRYFFAVDTGDHDGVLACFAQDGMVLYGTGESFQGPEELKQFAAKAIGDASIKGRMHLNFPLYFRREGQIIVLSSYLSSAQWTLPEPPKAFSSIRYIEDRFILTPNGWRIKQRIIHLWNSENVDALADLVRQKAARP
jgi:hypothetical protein